MFPGVAKGQAWRGGSFKELLIHLFKEKCAEIRLQNCDKWKVTNTKETLNKGVAAALSAQVESSGEWMRAFYNQSADGTIISSWNNSDGKGHFCPVP